VQDERFAMTGRVLEVKFAPTPDGKEYAFAGVDARGKVHAQAAQGSIQGEVVQLVTAYKDGRVVPEALDASEQVIVTDGKQSIGAERLRVTFKERPGEKPDDWQADVAEVTAAGKVVATLEDGTKVNAARLEADNAKQVARLLGEPLVIEREDAQLRARQLDITEGGKKAKTTGPGEFISIRPGKNADAATRKLNVRWTRTMVYDDAANTLDVQGHVDVEHSDHANEMNKLTASSLEIKLIKTDEAGADDERKLLRSLTARKDVVLLSTRRRTAERQDVERRLRMSGPTLTFDNATERAEVVGPGSLLVEDYTPHKQDKRIGKVKVSGRGATLFTWIGRLVMDGRQTDIVFERKVNMTHRPVGTKDLIEMQSDRLTANMKGLTGLEAMSTSEVESMRIDHIEAIGAVQVRDAQRLVSAHRLYYSGENQTALLEAKGDRAVQIVKIDEPRPVKAGKIMWDLQRDRIEVLRGGY